MLYNQTKKHHSANAKLSIIDGGKLIPSMKDNPLNTPKEIPNIAIKPKICNTWNL